MTPTTSSLVPASPTAVFVAKNGRNVPRLALTKAETAASLGVSVDFLEDHVWHELRLVRRGRLTLCSVRELERWLEREAANVLD